MHKKQCKSGLVGIERRMRVGGTRILYTDYIHVSNSQTIKTVAEGMQAEARSIVTQMASQIEQQSREQERRSKQIEETMDRLEKAIYAINVSG